MATRKLLLADDSVTIQKVVNLTFADEGIEVIAVGSGDAAIEKMAEVAPDLVMADVNMPGLSGYEVCERIKQNENFKSTPVILLVGSFEPFDEEEARRVGADDFLTKPFQSIRQLVSKVTVLLDANDRNAGQLYDATANNSFADTLEMQPPEITDSDQASDLGDAGMDDEMIQTNQVSSFALDESAKYETKDSEPDEDPEDYKKTQPLSVYDLKEFSFVAYSPEKENETQNFTENAGSDEYESQMSNENDSNETESQSFSENKPSENETQNFSENNSDRLETESQDSDENLLMENTAHKKENIQSFLDVSDDDLLEIPFDEDEEWETQGSEETEQIPTAKETDSTTQSREVQDEAPAGHNAGAGAFDSESQFSDQIALINGQDSRNSVSQSESGAPEENYYGENEVVVGTLLDPENDKSVNEEKTEGSTNSATQFSPELIDAIAQKVIEKLSDKVVREIAWEVVPEHADLIIKKMVEEKLKE